MLMTSEIALEELEVLNTTKQKKSLAAHLKNDGLRYITIG